MKFRLNPNLSYIIALYYKKPSSKGIGVRGSHFLRSAFINKCLEEKIVEPGKLLYSKEEVFFYHSKLRKFFNKIIEEIADRFIFVNDYSSSFFAGVFDSVGEIEKGGISLGKYELKDSIALQKLGFFNKKSKGKLFLEGKEKEFLRFIYPRLVVKKEEVEKILGSMGRY